MVSVDDSGGSEADAHEGQSQPERFRTRHDWEENPSISTSVARTVSAVTGDAAGTIDPLYAVVDLDALDEPLKSFRGDERATVTFTHNGWHVTVEATGEIVVEPVDADGF